MSMIRGRNTKPEVVLAAILRPLGLRLRRHQKIIGRPDLANQKRKIAIFVDGCFWHQCPKHYQAPKSNAVFWSQKIMKNVARDKKVNRELRRMGYAVIRLWEYEIDKPDLVYRKVQRFVSSADA